MLVQFVVLFPHSGNAQSAVPAAGPVVRVQKR